MRMRDGCGQRIGGVRLRYAAGGQQPLDHELHLLLAGMARAHHAFLDVVGRIFGDLKPRFRRRQQRHRTGMAKFQRRLRIASHKSLFHRDGRGPMTLDDKRQFAMQDHQPHAQPSGRFGGDHAMGNMGKPRARHLDHPPAHGRKARIKTQNANCKAHGVFVRFMFLGWLDRPQSSRPGARKTRSLSGQLRDQRVRQRIIAIDILHVVMIVQNLHQLHQRLAGFVNHFHRVLRPPHDRGRGGGPKLGLQRVAHGRQSLPCR